MEKAALRAEEIGRNDLADEIRKDYTAYSDPNRSFKPTVETVYNQVEDAVISTHGKLSFEGVIEFVANENGMTSRTLLSKYKKLRTVYDEHHAAIGERKDTSSCSSKLRNCKCP